MTDTVEHFGFDSPEAAAQVGGFGKLLYRAAAHELDAGSSAGGCIVHGPADEGVRLALFTGVVLQACGELAVTSFSKGQQE